MVRIELLDLYPGCVSYLKSILLLVSFPAVWLLSSLNGYVPGNTGSRASETGKPVRRTYVETFDDGPGGWYGGRKFALPVWDGVAYCYSPWWVDANHAPPGAGWRRLASRYGKKIVHVPLSRFSQQTIGQLRMFHVLNGQDIRSYAAHFIRKA